MWIANAIGINCRPLGVASYAKQLAEMYKARVLADGGYYEGVDCMIFKLNDLDSLL